MSYYHPSSSIFGSIIGFGSALAMIISWGVSKSIFWAVIHGLFGWFYVLYYAFMSGRLDAFL